MSKDRAIDEFLLSLIGFVGICGLSVYVYVALENPAFLEFSHSAPVAKLAPKKKVNPSPKPAVDKSPEPVASAPRYRPMPQVKKPETPAKAAVEPLDIDDYMGKAIEMVDSGNWQEAEKVLLALLAEDPENEAALVELAMIYLLDKKDPAMALPIVKRALVLNTNNGAMVSELMGIYEEQNNLQEATSYLMKLADEQSSSGALEYGIAQSLIRTGESDKALEYLERSLDTRVGFERDDALEQMGDLYYETGQKERAMESWKETLDRQKRHLEEHPGDREFLAEQHFSLKVKRISLLMEQEKTEEAMAELEALKKENPSNEVLSTLENYLKM